MPHPSYDIALILGAALHDDGRPRPALVRRVAHGVALHHQGVAERLLMSGGQVHGPVPEAWVMRDLALRAGVGADRLLNALSGHKRFGGPCGFCAAMAWWRWAAPPSRHPPVGCGPSVCARPAPFP